MKLIVKNSLGLWLMTSCSLVSLASEQEQSKGLWQDTSWSLLNRTVYDNRNYRHGGKNSAARNAYKAKLDRHGKAEEWGYGLMATVNSGFTQGTLGLGFDALGYLGVKLDSGGGRAGKARLLAVKNDGHVQSNYERAGGAIKARISSTTLKYGVQRPKTPIFSSSDSRLLPETATGWLITSNEFRQFTMQAGHFTAAADRNASSSTNDLVVNYANPTFKKGKSFNFAGGSYKGIENVTFTSYVGRYQDNWQTYYLGSYYKIPLANKDIISFDIHLYHSEDYGKSYAGQINNTTGSLLASYQTGFQRFTAGYQKVKGDTPFDYVTRGAIWLGNAVQLSDFNAPHEQSWQLRYDLDMLVFGINGLSFSVAYIKGSHIDGTKMSKQSAYHWLGYGKGGKHWERDVEIKYIVPSGKAKDLAFSIRHNVHRANKAQAELDTDQIRVAVEYPIAW